ncbi:MAG: hypothetical protein U1F58_09735 [Burkholderiales bacterium]
MSELQFLMTRQIYYGNENAPRTLASKLDCLRFLARFAEARSCTVRDVLTQSALLDACGEALPDYVLDSWLNWLRFLRQLDPQTRLGFAIASPKRWKELVKRAKDKRDGRRQFAPLPTRIYAALINNLSKELDDIEAHKAQLIAALRQALALYREGSVTQRSSVGSLVIGGQGLTAYIEMRGYSPRRIKSLGSVVREVFQLCKLQIHLFSGMRDEEARHLPYHCMSTETGPHGREHCLIVGTTTKFNRGRRLRTRWVTTKHDGFRAIRLAQEFADVIYEWCDVRPNASEGHKDHHPLFPSCSYLPWKLRCAPRRGARLSAQNLALADASKSLLPRLCPDISSEDIAELEQLDPFRTWREEPEFAEGSRWPLTTHQLRRSLAVYANASGLVRLSSLRRQLQQLTREMAMYYGRGSTFCKNFLADDPVSYRKHVAVDWQDGAEEAEMLVFVRDVLNSAEPMFGGAGSFYERQRQRGEVMSRDEVAQQMKAGLLACRDGPLGKCTRPGICEVRKGLNLVDTACATEGCRYLVGKHSKIVQTIRLKRAAMTHITAGSITDSMEREELEALERMERVWRPKERTTAASRGDEHA